MSFQQQIPLAGQEFRPQEKPPSGAPTPVESLPPPINHNTTAQEECTNWGKTLITSTKGKLSLTRSIGLPPHAPVAQKIADQR